MNRRENLRNHSFTPVKLKWRDWFKKCIVFKVDESKDGLGCLALSDEFSGRGTRIRLEDNQNYIIRWVKVYFIFFYRFGLEKI